MYNMFTTPKLDNTVQAQQQRNLVSPQIQEKEAPIDSNSSTAGMDYLNSLYTDPEEEKRLRKASVMNQRILAIGDAIRHIGNIASTVNYAPAQQLNSPVAEEQARYERGKALRDRANQQYYTYMQAKAAQDAAAKRWEAEQTYKNNMLQHYRDQDRRLWTKQGDTANYHLALIDLRKEQQAIDKAYKEGKLGIDRYNAESRRISAKAAQLRAGAGGGGGQGGKYWAYDEDGNIHYYPNKSMYEQGVYEFGEGLSTSEEYNKGNDVFGKPQKGVRKRSVTSMGGERARQARQKKNTNGKKSNPMGGSSNGKKKNPMS